MERRKLILMVEDEEREQEIYGKLLWYNGFDVVFAKDGEEGLELARERPPDIVLLDLMLPKLDGFEFCTRFRSMPRTAAVPIVVLSARRRAEFGSAARLAGCDDFLEKPVPPLAVLHKIEELIGRPPLPGDIEDRSGTPEPGEQTGSRQGSSRRWRVGRNRPDGGGFPQIPVPPGPG